jgi:methylated-DNA-[protein]-cysteine S-methyltransferase
MEFMAEFIRLKVGGSKRLFHKVRPMKQWKMKSVIGDLYLVASEVGLRGIYAEQQSVPMLSTLRNSEIETAFLAQAVRQLQEYFSCERRIFDLPLDVCGTDFQKRVWKALLAIPYGQTRSYLDIARAIKNEKAVRAVGSANGKNPLWIIVPCHRVIAANGTIGGYAGGLKIKKQLLELEGAETNGLSITSH